MRSGAGRAQGTPCSLLWSRKNPCALLTCPAQVLVCGGMGQQSPQSRAGGWHPTVGATAVLQCPSFPFTSSSGAALMAPSCSHSTDLGLFGVFCNTAPWVSAKEGFAALFSPCCYFVPCIPLK